VLLSTAARQHLARTASRHRRLVAAALAAAAVAVGLQALSPSQPPRTLVLTASHDLAGGTQVQAKDLARVALPSVAVPDGALVSSASVVGRMLAGPVRAGQTITDLQLVSRTLLTGYGPGVVASPVRIADAASVGLLQVGDLVDVLGADPRAGGSTSTVAYNARVIAIPAVSSDGGPLGTGALIVLAVSPAVARSLAGSAVTDQLSFILCARTCAE
jgi:pilus assembly protein CpaB